LDIPLVFFRPLISFPQNNFFPPKNKFLNIFKKVNEMYKEFIKNNRKIKNNINFGGKKGF
jgi:hypothetical protein